MIPAKYMEISGHKIGPGNPCFIVAEAGSAHGGDLGTTLDMIRNARMAGADAVKFQSFLADELVPRNHPEYKQLKRTEMPKEWYPRLREAAEENGIVVFSTVSNETTLGWMADLDFPCYKVASGNLDHYPLIGKAARLGKPMILSTAYADMAEIGTAVRTCLEDGNRNLAILHCVGNYPAFPEEVSLMTMAALREGFGCPVGYSDHTDGEVACEAAAILGADIVEKHVRPDRRYRYGDLAVSSGFLQFSLMSRFIRTAEAMMGVPEKKLGSREIMAKPSMRRVVCARRDIEQGEEIAMDMVSFLRPVGRSESMTGKPCGLPPVAIKWLTGKKAKRHISAQSPIHWQNVEMDLGDGR